MNINKLYEDIKYNYKQKDYVKTLELIDEYFSLDNVGVFDLLLSIYVRCLTNLYRTDEALEKLELLHKLFPNCYTEVEYDYEKARMYIRANDLEKAELLLEKCNRKINKPRYYFDRAKTYLQQGKYEEALKYFNECIKVCKDKKLTELALNNIQKINRYFCDGTFVEINYKYFKEKGFVIEPGYIVYAKKIENIPYDPNYDKYQQYRIPYLIWKIEDNKCYAFPVTTKIRSDYAYVLSNENYPNSNFDRTIKDRLVCIEENNIEQVVEHINKRDFYNIINYMYTNQYMAYKRNELDSDNFFLSTMMQEFDIQKYDIILTYNIENKCIEDYFVVDETHEKYLTIKVDFNDGVYTVGNFDIKEFEKNEFILNDLKISLEQKQKLISELPANYQKRKRY